MYKLICKHPINISCSPMSQLKVGFCFITYLRNFYSPICERQLRVCQMCLFQDSVIICSWKAQEDKKLSKSRFLNNFWRYDVKDESSKEENETKSKFLKFFTLPNYVDSNIHFFSNCALCSNCTLFTNEYFFVI